MIKSPNLFSKLISTFLYIAVLLIFNSCYAKEDNSVWYYILENKLSKLKKTNLNETIPLFIGAEENRILKIQNFKGSTVKNIIINSKNTTVEVYQLPLIKNFDNKDILDIIYPIKLGKPLYKDESETKFFLVKFKANVAGNDNVDIKIITEQKSYNFSKKIKIGNFKNNKKIDLNVFAYFDYNFILKNLKNEITEDLINHSNTVLVIPPYVIPVLEKNIGSTDSLVTYLKGTSGRFRYYVLYLNLTNNATPQTDISPNNLYKWYKNIESALAKINILPDQILIFPYDEPKGNDIAKLLKIKENFRKSGLKTPFYSTIDNAETYKILGGKIEYLQVIPEILEKSQTNNSNSVLWTYQLTYGSRNRTPEEYRQMSLRALKNNATGIGLWSYSDISVAADEKTQREFNSGSPTWDLNYKAWSAEYSLIYRQNDTLFSSLRWEALSYGIDEYLWFQKLIEKYGSKKIQQKLVDIFNGNIKESEIDQLKLSLIN